MTKADVRRLMLEKGEKIALYLCGAMLLVFAVWSVMAALDSIAPEDKAKELKSSADGISQKIVAKSNLAYHDTGFYLVVSG